jgi:hypothetical protein
VRPAARRASRGSRGQAEQPQRPLLLEVQRAGDRAADPPGPPAELGHLRPGGRIGDDFQAEREGRRADVVAPLYRQRERDRVQVTIGELPVRGLPVRGLPVRGLPGRGLPGRGLPVLGLLASAAGRLAQQREQPERLPVAEHPGRRAEALRRLSDAHDR